VNIKTLIADRPGTFIVVEGPDGVGKTTATRELARRLSERGLDVVQTRNVGGTPLAERIRAITLDASTRLDPIQQNVVIAAARRSNLIEVVIPALEAGSVVLCDRYVSSALALQTTNREGGFSIGDQDVVDMHRIVCDSFAPELTLTLHAPADVRLARRTARNEGHDRFDNGDMEYDAAIAAKYRDAGKVLGHPTVDVDASDTMERTVDQMEAAALSVLAEREAKD
jgi:dTMP kinase